MRIGGGHFPSKRCDSEILGNCGSQETVVLLCLAGEPKETEEDERAEDGTPSTNLESVGVVRVERGPGIFRDLRIFRMNAGPGDPWPGCTTQGVRHNSPHGQGDGEAKVSGGHKHKTPVAAVGEAGIGGDEILESLSPLDESTEGKGWCASSGSASEIAVRLVEAHLRSKQRQFQ